MVLHTCQVFPAPALKPVAPAALVKRVVESTTLPAAAVMVEPLAMDRGAALMIWTLLLLLSPVDVVPRTSMAPMFKLALLFTVKAPTAPWLAKADKRLPVLLRLTLPEPANTKPPVLPSITPLAVKSVPLTRNKLLAAKLI